MREARSSLLVVLPCMCSSLKGGADSRAMQSALLLELCLIGCPNNAIQSHFS